jgi:hypothetical protein
MVELSEVQDTRFDVRSNSSPAFTFESSEKVVLLLSSCLRWDISRLMCQPVFCSNMVAVNRYPPLFAQNYSWHLSVGQLTFYNVLLKAVGAITIQILSKIFPATEPNGEGSRWT